MGAKHVEFLFLEGDLAGVSELLEGVDAQFGGEFG